MIPWLIIKTIYLLLTLSRYKIIISDITGSHYHLRDITLRASDFTEYFHLAYSSFNYSYRELTSVNHKFRREYYVCNEQKMTAAVLAITPLAMSLSASF